MIVLAESRLISFKRFGFVMLFLSSCFCSLTFIKVRSYWISNNDLGQEENTEPARNTDELFYSEGVELKFSVKDAMKNGEILKWRLKKLPQFQHFGWIWQFKEYYTWGNTCQSCYLRRILWDIFWQKIFNVQRSKKSHAVRFQWNLNTWSSIFKLLWSSITTLY